MEHLVAECPQKLLYTYLNPHNFSLYFHLFINLFGVFLLFRCSVLFCVLFLIVYGLVSDVIIL